HAIAGPKLRGARQRIDLALLRTQQPEESHPRRGAVRFTPLIQIRAARPEHDDRRAAGRREQLGDEATRALLGAKAEPARELARFGVLSAGSGGDERAHARLKGPASADRARPRSWPRPARGSDPPGAAPRT